MVLLLPPPVQPHGKGRLPAAQNVLDAILVRDRLCYPRACAAAAAAVAARVEAIATIGVTVGANGDRVKRTRDGRNAGGAGVRLPLRA